jgi:hypothetical protein
MHPERRLEQSLTEAISLNVKDIHLTLEGDAFLGLFKPRMGLNTEFSPHQFEPPTGSPRQHRQKEEDPHLHTRDIQKQSMSDYAQQD